MRGAPARSTLRIPPIAQAIHPIAQDTSGASFVHLVPHPIAARTESFDAGAQCVCSSLPALERLSPEPFSLRMRFTTADTFMVAKCRTGLVVLNQRLDVAAKPSWPPDPGSDPRLSGTGHSHVMCGWPPIGKGSFALRHVQPLAVMAGLTRPSGPALRPAQVRHHLGHSDRDRFRAGR